MVAREGSVKFLVIGDTGTGDRTQYAVAARIAKGVLRHGELFAGIISKRRGLLQKLYPRC